MRRVKEMEVKGTTENLTLEEQEEQFNKESLKSTLFSSILFVGGGIVAFILLLAIVYMMRF